MFLVWDRGFGLLQHNKNQLGNHQRRETKFQLAPLK